MLKWAYPPLSSKIIEECEKFKSLASKIQIVQADL